MNRKNYLDNVRVVAMFMVVAIHVCIAALDDFDTYSLVDATIYRAITNLFHCAVPLFFMISGTLILPPQKEISLKKLWTNYIRRYALVIIIFGTAFSFIEELFTTKTIGGVQS